MSIPLQESSQRGNLNQPPSTAKPTSHPPAQQGDNKNTEIENIQRRLAYFRYELQILFNRLGKLKS